MNFTTRPSIIMNNSTLMPQLKVNTTVFKLDNESKIIARCFYSIILIFGTFGNVLTCYVILSRKFMRRVIHIYTFNLAVADLMVILLYVPVEIVRNENDIVWTMGLTMCKISNIVTPTCLIASICTLVAITLDRHRGVTRPFQWRGDSSKLLLISIPAMWIIAIICSAPLFNTATVVLFDNGAHYCIEGWSGTTDSRGYWIAMFIIQVLLPLLVIVIANSHMIYVMQSLSGKTKHSEQSAQHKQHKRMIWMVVALVFVYAICTSPQHIVFFWYEFGDLEPQLDLSQHVYKASNLMVIVQCAINPVIYGIGRKDFKGAFKSILQVTMVSKFFSMSSLSSSRSRKRSTAKQPSVNETLPHNPFENGAPILCTSPMEVTLMSINNKRVEKLRKKSSVPTITDTPPPHRRETEREPLRRISEPIYKKQKKGFVFTREKNLSLPASMTLDEKVPAFKLKHPKIKEENATHSEMNGTPDVSHFDWDFYADDLAVLLKSPETVI